jgi:hypothetical protein
MLIVAPIYYQASPHDPENFPFVVLGNKIDMEDSKRMVRSPNERHLPSSSHIHPTQSGLAKAGYDMVPIQGQHPIL